MYIMEFGLIIAFIFTIIFPLLDLEISHNIVLKLLLPATYFGCASHWHLFLWLSIPGLVILIWMISTVYIWSSLRQQIAGVILIILDKHIHMYLSWSSMDISQSYEFFLYLHAAQQNMLTSRNYIHGCKNRYKFIEVWVRNEVKWCMLQSNSQYIQGTNVKKKNGFFVKTKFIFTERDFVSLVCNHNICETIYG